MLTSVKSDTVKLVSGLDSRRVRERTGLFKVEGINAVQELFQSRPDLVDEVYVTEAFIDGPHSEVLDAWVRGEGSSAAWANGFENFPGVTLVTESVMRAMGDLRTSPGILAVCRQPDQALRLPKNLGLAVVLHRVSDPGNLGSVIRLADALAADALILSGNSTDPFSPKVVRSAAGSLFHLNTMRSDLPLPELCARLTERGAQCLAADVNGEPLEQAAGLSNSLAWFFGNEAHGFAPEELSAMDRVLRLPMPGRAESLNLACAAAACLYLTRFGKV